jgi:hypothetical protein
MAEFVQILNRVFLFRNFGLIIIFGGVGLIFPPPFRRHCRGTKDAILNIFGGEEDYYGISISENFD